MVRVKVVNTSERQIGRLNRMFNPGEEVAVEAEDSSTAARSLAASLERIVDVLGEKELREVEERLQNLRWEQTHTIQERTDALRVWRKQSHTYLRLLEGPNLKGML